MATSTPKTYNITDQSDMIFDEAKRIFNALEMTRTEDGEYLFNPIINNVKGLKGGEEYEVSTFTIDTQEGSVSVKATLTGLDKDNALAHLQINPLDNRFVWKADALRIAVEDPTLFVSVFASWKELNETFYGIPA